ncbi:MAG: T9SS type A sorting domain-containing protein, partial [Flavobacteriales bacterium]|nr:T9SS type A sorting domain-containing protein [Flavobacteriales bacterium]
VEVRVYANDGRLVLTQSNLTLNQSNHEIDLSQFARGQYTIVVSQAGIANQYKIILN